MLILESLKWEHLNQNLLNTLNKNMLKRDMSKIPLNKTH